MGWARGGWARGGWGMLAHLKESEGGEEEEEEGGMGGEGGRRGEERKGRMAAAGDWKEGVRRLTTEGRDVKKRGSA